MDEQRPWVPANNHDQSCAFCGAKRPLFVHRLEPGHVEFRLTGKGYTLRTFWAACARCEALVSDRDDAALLGLMHCEQEDDLWRAAGLAAFRASDLGSEALADGPPDTVRP
jgi:hypothetical protein